MIEEIRKRIKARMDNTDAAGDYDEYADGQGVGLASALRIIDEVEKDHTVPSDIQEDKAAMDYYLNLPNSSYGEGGNLLPRSINDAFKAGAEWQRERMMKEAVECNVIWYDGRLLDFTQEQLDAALDKIGAGVDAKVSVIIIKKEK